METISSSNKDSSSQRNPCPVKMDKHETVMYARPNHVSTVMLYDVAIVCLWIDGKERLCLAQISNTLLKDFSYNEIHNRRVALGITCVQCTPVQLEILRRAGAMPVSSRRCGMITKREAERLVKSFLEDISPPKLPEDFTFDVVHDCGWGCKGDFYPARYNSSRAKCVKCKYCNMFFSANKFIFHYHRLPDSKYNHPDAANFNSWRRHLTLDNTYSKDDAGYDDLLHAWEDVKAMFNGGSRKRMLPSTFKSCSPGGSLAKLHKHCNSSERKPPQMTKSNVTSPLLIQPNVPSFYKPQPSKLPIFNQGLYQNYHPHFMHCTPSSVIGMSDNGRIANAIGTNESLYPSYEMIWAKHLGLPHLSETMFPMSAVAPRPVFAPKTRKESSSDESSVILSPKKEDKGNTRLNSPDNSLKCDYSAFSIIRTQKDIFRPYALEESIEKDHGNNSANVSALLRESDGEKDKSLDESIILVHELDHKPDERDIEDNDEAIHRKYFVNDGERSPKVTVDSDIESDV